MPNTLREFRECTTFGDLVTRRSLVNRYFLEEDMRTREVVRSRIVNAYFCRDELLRLLLTGFRRSPGVLYKEGFWRDPLSYEDWSRQPVYDRRRLVKRLYVSPETKLEKIIEKSLIVIDQTLLPNIVIGMVIN